MCGIVGILDPSASRNSEASAALIERMADEMVHRGPDSSGSWTDPDAGVVFGHRRLSILDLSEQGHQPMVSGSGRYVVTYNGEIYNHREIAKELVSEGVRFRGHSDTEILIEAISTWGLRRALERADGMFAVGCWDREARVLTLARDRMGEKPLYYGTIPTGEFVFASSLDAIRRHPDSALTLDPDAVALFLRYKYVPAPWSIYNNISKLEPGEMLVVGANGAIRSRETYWSYFDLVNDSTPYRGDPYEAVEELDRLLEKSVARRLVADVPVGVFLSGGIDSSTVASIAAAASSTPIRTFTIGSTSSEYDESHHARNVAEHLGADHTELIVNERDALDAVQELSAFHDEPFADSSQIPTRLVSELASESVTVALSGDAGDELFGGYNRYTSVPGIWRRLSGIPQPLRRAATRAGRRIPPRAWDRAASVIPESRRPQQVALKASKVLDIADAGSPHEMFHQLCSHWTDPASIVAGAAEPATMHTDPGRWPRTSDIVDHMMAVDAVTFLPDDILAKVDRAAMSVSLETRIPFLDRGIIEFAIALPTSFKIRSGISKWPLRKVLDKYVPAHLVNRPKAGFGLPIDAWLRGPLQQWAEERVIGDLASPLLDRTALQTSWSVHQSGSANHAYELWDVIMLSDWCAHRGIGI